MLRPYSAAHTDSNVASRLPLHRYGRTKKSVRILKPVWIIKSMCILFFLTSDFAFYPIEKFLRTSRNICAYFLGDLETDSFWQEAFSSLADYLPTDVTSMPPGNIGFVLTIPTCPEDAKNHAGYQTHEDPGSAFYDAAAVLKHIIELNLKTTEKYTATMHAIVHPDAIFCHEPNGGQYDRVRVLQSLGYIVSIKGSPIIDETGAMVDISDPYVAENVNNDAGERDLITLYASTIENEAALVLTDFNTVFINPLDPLLDDFINNPLAEVAFSITPPENQEEITLTVSPTQSPVTPAPVAPTAVPTTAAPTTAAPTNSPVTPSPTAPTTSPLPTEAPTPQLEPLSAETIAAMTNGDGTIDMNTIVLLKTDRTLVENITNLYTSTTYDPITGWADSGIATYNGSLGTTGILTYYYTHLAPEKAMVMDECKYGNGRRTKCKKKKPSEATVVNMEKCGAPWTCPDQLSLAAEEKAQCDVYANFWYQARKDFEDCLQQAPGSDHNGTFKQNVALGFCKEKGKMGYSRVVGDSQCNKKKIKKESSHVLKHGTKKSKSQAQKMTLTAGQSTQHKEVCMSGAIELPNVAYNIALVLDHSVSTGLESTGGSRRLHNSNDGPSDTILDTEMAAALGLLESICGQGELDNDSVTIGFISFNTVATYHGMYSPCDPSAPSTVNPILRAAITSLLMTGDSNYDPALEKSIDFYQEAPVDRVNTMFFMSDGKPTIPGVTEAQQTLTWENSGAPASSYTTNLLILDNFEVHRVCVGVGSGSDVRHGYDLDIIDNTDTGPSERSIAKVLIHNPVVGKLVNFQVIVNDEIDPHISLSNLSEGVRGYALNEVVAHGFDPYFGSVNKLELVVQIDADGDLTTTDDVYTLRNSALIPGELQ